ncbi:hypothetical protein [Pseudomonas amygdali]|uniref:hypothetical protein n=1 Tax=Pseudomonas amygdali TaxID=47877 RepID=UPI0001CC4424|nr:hypothetical protein [Pseudomonas amygdali]
MLARWSVQNGMLEGIPTLEFTPTLERGNENRLYVLRWRVRNARDYLFNLTVILVITTVI